ncbi:MAG: Fmu (Sun) domain-containing protein [Ginsengibacter sp.]
MTANAADLPASSDNDYSKKHLHYASALVGEYQGLVPFHIYLKKYFSANKKHGSKDRKKISSLCYNYFRLGYGVTSNLSIDEKFLFADFLCEAPVPGELKSGKTKADRLRTDLTARLEKVKGDFDPNKILPFTQFLSPQINSTDYARSFLLQPQVFVRIRPGKQSAVTKKITEAGINFGKISESCLVFPAGTDVFSLLKIDAEAVIQDYNSQVVSSYLIKYISGENESKNVDKEEQMPVWDCCAGSGGKSILAFDFIRNIRLTVSDIRESILSNLKKRFRTAAIKDYDSLIVDLSKNIFPFDSSFQSIIADVPCTGSGTWARTPEQLLFFREKEIENYASRQQSIVQNAVRQLRENGIIFYITCSVFKRENEENIEYFIQHFPLDLLEMKYLKGYHMLANTLFIAVLRKRALVA